MNAMWLLKGEREIVYLRLIHLAWAVFVCLFVLIGFLFFY